jgi:hypothetical protein
MIYHEMSRSFERPAGSMHVQTPGGGDVAGVLILIFAAFLSPGAVLRVEPGPGFDREQKPRMAHEVTLSCV